MLCSKVTAIKRQKITVLKFSRLHTTTQIYSELTFNDISKPWRGQKFKYNQLQIASFLPAITWFVKLSSSWNVTYEDHFNTVNKMVIKEDKKEKLDDSSDEKVRYQMVLVLIKHPPYTSFNFYCTFTYFVNEFQVGGGTWQPTADGRRLIGRMVLKKTGNRSQAHTFQSKSETSLLGLKVIF